MGLRTRDRIAKISAARRLARRFSVTQRMPGGNLRYRSRDGLWGCRWNSARLTWIVYEVGGTWDSCVDCSSLQEALDLLVEY